MAVYLIEQLINEFNNLKEASATVPIIRNDDYYDYSTILDVYNEDGEDWVLADIPAIKAVYGIDPMKNPTAISMVDSEENGYQAYEFEESPYIKHVRTVDDHHDEYLIDNKYTVISGDNSEGMFQGVSVLIFRTEDASAIMKFLIDNSKSTQQDVQDVSDEIPEIPYSEEVWSEFDGSNESLNKILKLTGKSAEEITSITIPDGVTEIGDKAFWDCYNLKSITIPNSVTRIGYMAFSGCGKLTSIEIPSSVTEIGDYAFQRCTSLTSITIPEGVTEIGNSTFASCEGLKSVIIPSSVTSIGEEAFDRCKGLTSVEIPEGVVEMGSYAFVHCISLTSITIPNSITSIGKHALYNCPVIVKTANPYVIQYCIENGIKYK